MHLAVSTIFLYGCLHLHSVFISGDRNFYAEFLTHGKTAEDPDLCRCLFYLFIPTAYFILGFLFHFLGAPLLASSLFLLSRSCLFPLFYPLFPPPPPCLTCLTSTFLLPPHPWESQATILTPGQHVSCRIHIESRQVHKISCCATYR